MTVIIFILTFIFLLSAFIVNPGQHVIQNSLFSYLVYEIYLTNKYFLAFVLGFVFLTLLFFRFNFNKKYPVGRTFFFSALQVVFVVALGFFIAYILLFFIAFTQLNIFSTLININPKIIGVESDKNIVVNRLKEKNFVPEIITSEYDAGEILSKITSATTGTNTYYGNNVLSSVPDFLIFPIKKPDTSFVIIDNKIIVIQAKENDLQTISSFLGYHLLKNYFPTRKIKQDAKILVLNKNHYAKYREEDANKKLEKVDDELKKIQGKVSSLLANIETNKANISESSDFVKQEKVQAYDEYRKCFFDKNPAELCRDLQKRWDAKIQIEKEKIDNWNEDIKSDEKLIDAYKYYDDFFKSQRENIEILIEKSPNENGVFLPKDSIRLVISGSEQKDIVSFFEALTHEYLHFGSFISESKKFDSSFFEEGLTEYFARKIMKESFGIETNFGYPVQVKIITAMTNMITESEFADIYFTKDQDALERALNRVYGDDFYKNNYISFETLQYISDPKEVLKLANGIMKKIGGGELTEKDLVSEFLPR